MAAGEFVSVRSQRELLDASRPTQVTLSAAQHLDINANELELIYRARGMSEEDAHHRALERFGHLDCDCNNSLSYRPDADSSGSSTAALGSDVGAAAASFAFFASGALIPLLPYLFGMGGGTAMLVSLALVVVALFITGSIVGLLSGASPLWRGVRQAAIGVGATVITYLLGLAFGVAVS